VIDIDDGNKVKIADIKKSIMKDISSYFKVNKVDPGGTDAPIFVVNREGSGKDNTRYKATAMRDAWKIPQELWAECRERCRELAEESGGALSEKLMPPAPAPAPAAAPQAPKSPAPPVDEATNF
jgi:hypothetical protein